MRGNLASVEMPVNYSKAATRGTQVQLRVSNNVECSPCYNTLGTIFFFVCFYDVVNFAYQVYQRFAYKI